MLLPGTDYGKETSLCGITTPSRTCAAFEPSSKRRRGYPSEAQVKRGLRVVHGDKELRERLGKDDLCLCGSGRCFQAVLPQLRAL
jgi:hypothetical protein